MVNRNRLVERARNSASRVIALIAPAGYGKSFLARGILAAETRPGVEWDGALAGDDAAGQLRTLAASSAADALLAFDSLETLRDDGDALGALSEIIRSKGDRTLVLSGRPPFPLLNTRVLPPGSFVRFGPDELRFTGDDVRSAISETSEAEIAEILAVTGGWPFGVMALAERAGSLADALAALGAGTMGDVSDYIYNEIIAAVPDDLRPLLLAAAGVGEHGIAAIAQVALRDDTSNALQLLAAIVPLAIGDERVGVHPLVAPVIERRFAEEIRRMRAAVATRSFAARGRNMAPAELLTEVKQIRASLPPESDAAVIRGLDGYLAFFALEAGEKDYAEEILAAHVHAIGSIPTTNDEAVLLAAQGRLFAERYQIEQATEYYERALPFVENLSVNAMITTSLAFLRLLLGDQAGAAVSWGRALATARRSEDPGAVFEVLARGTFEAWFSGDELEYGRRLAFLDEELGRNGETPFRAFRDAIRTSSIDQLASALSARWRAQTALIVAGTQRDVRSSEATLEWASLEAARSADTFTELLVLLATSITSPGRHDELQGPISSTMVRLPVPVLHESLASFLSGGDGAPLLARFVRRFAEPASTALQMAGGALRVNVLAGTISRGDTVLRLSNRPLALVLSLATMGAVSRERLCEMLWPEADDVSAANTLKMCVRRARQQLDDPSAIVFEKSLWSLRDDVVVDIIEIERNLRAISPGASLSPTNRAYLESLFEFLSKMQPAEIFNSEGMEAIGLRVGAVRHQIVTRLGEGALESGDLPAALNYADLLRKWDPTDEASYMLSIRAYALSGNSAEAYREYRLYAAQCERELGIKPELDIDELLSASRV